MSSLRRRDQNSNRFRAPPESLSRHLRELLETKHDLQSLKDLERQCECEQHHGLLAVAVALAHLPLPLMDE